MEDDSIIICPADQGKAVVIEARDMYLIKTQHHIIKKDYTLMAKNEKSVHRRLHGKLMDQLISMVITDTKEQKVYTAIGPVIVSIALLIKVH